MNKKLKAVDLYHHAELKFNCAQAIAYRWADSEAEANALSVEFQKFGGGRAPQGVCGALYAGLHKLSDKPSAQQQLKVVFETSATSHECRDIRKANSLSCKGCVDLVDNFLEESLN